MDDVVGSDNFKSLLRRTYAVPVHGHAGLNQVMDKVIVDQATISSKIQETTKTMQDLKAQCSQIQRNKISLGLQQLDQIIGRAVILVARELCIIMDQYEPTTSMARCLKEIESVVTTLRQVYLGINPQEGSYRPEASQQPSMSV